MNFRFKALAKRRQPDRLDTPMVLASPRGWIITLVIASCMALVTFWSAVGRMPQTVAATGTLAYAGGISTVAATHEGHVQQVTVKPGDVIDGETTVAAVKGETGPMALVAGASGRVLRTDIAPGAALTVGDPILQLEPGYARDAALTATLLVPAHSIGQIEVGQSVLVTVAGADPRRFGLLKGEVAAKAAFPQTGEEMRVGPTVVTVALTKADTPTGYAWTSETGPDQGLESQTPVTAEIVTGYGSPLALAFGG
ncbi:MAG: HlyD family efflux transporter periplasmic adaptor subunit [Propionibacteriaceae bacterium]|nr:HlyD family efflux transporter periplasmic adaptor subunit [Propionibacteriaceae bacterium]